ncbi:hypothetical protein O3G_MSEX006103 [Manduca sexta]|uniref:AIMP2 thioredoxin-like domain-containing protein n=1 Tax=Manduca sexta TaxID=7130 RepID=A0A921Z289_MANSE|nr:hypothetical protein O3G_MSEX006103 [Manduca sexta]
MFFLKSFNIQLYVFFKQEPNKKMAELEQRQDELLKKLDFLYERIKAISSNCKSSGSVNITLNKKTKPVLIPEEVVLVISPDYLPWYLNLLLKNSSDPVNISYHSHSSVPNEKLPKIKAYVSNLIKKTQSSKINLRLIFKCVSADSELKLSSLEIPIVGNVNIMRYLSLAYPDIIPYDNSDHNIDNLLDVVHVLERTPEKNKEAAVKKIFAQYDQWIYGNKFSIVDLATYNVIKQWRTVPKYVPKTWFDKCDKLCL